MFVALPLVAGLGCGADDCEVQQQIPCGNDKQRGAVVAMGAVVARVRADARAKAEATADANCRREGEASGEWLECGGVVGDASFSAGIGSAGIGGIPAGDAALFWVGLR